MYKTNSEDILKELGFSRAAGFTVSKVGVCVSGVFEGFTVYADEFQKPFIIMFTRRCNITIKDFENVKWEVEELEPSFRVVTTHAKEGHHAHYNDLSYDKANELANIFISQAKYSYVHIEEM